MRHSEAREIFLKEYEGDSGSSVTWLGELRSASAYGLHGFIAIADHITGLEKKLEYKQGIIHHQLDVLSSFAKDHGVEKDELFRQGIVIKEQEKRLRDNTQEINNLKAEVKDLAESREAVRKQLKYADDTVAYLHKERSSLQVGKDANLKRIEELENAIRENRSRSMDIQGYDYVGAESIGAYGSGQTYVRIWRKR